MVKVSENRCFRLFNILLIFLNIIYYNFKVKINIIAWKNNIIII